jgi:cation diffusion facilitator CzcD-associated flavoprotein CzcO
VVTYLEDYAKRFQLDIRLNQHVSSARHTQNGWEVQTQDSLHIAPNLVIACGYARQPLTPSWPGMESFPGKIIHSAEYKNGAEFNRQDVLVVGFGNSGGEIAMDLHDHGAKPSIAVRSAVNVIPRELAGIPILSIGVVQSRLPSWLGDAINAPILRMVIGDI